MRTQLRFIAVLALVAAGASFGVIACSSDAATDTGPTAQKDSGTPNQPDTSTPPVTTPDSGEPGIDAALPDAGACKSDASTCNSCFTPQVDPVNGCSPATVNCIPFDNKRVPANAP